MPVKHNTKTRACPVKTVGWSRWSDTPLRLESLLLLKVFGLVAPDEVTILPHLALRPFLRPPEMPDRDLGRRLVYVEGDPGTEPHHGAPEEYVREGLGHLAAKGVEDLGPEEAGLDSGRRGERYPQGVVVPGLIQNLRGADAVDLEEPLGQLLGKTVSSLELGGERLEVFRVAAGERPLVGAALRGLAAELLVYLVHHLASEGRVGGELATYGGDETFYLGILLYMIVEQMPAGDAAPGALWLVGERAPARGGKEGVAARQGCLRDNAVGLLDQVLYLFLAGLHVVEVVLVADVGRPDQVPPVPRHNKVWPPVFLCLDVECRL